MELVCENGQIFAKSRRPNNNGYFQSQRTQSLLDLYETEYDEDFKKNIKNLGDSQVVPGSEPQHPQQDEETDEQTNDNNNKKKKKIKPSKTESERNIWKRNKRSESSKLMNDSLKGLKNIEVTTAPPDEQSVAVGRSRELYIASSSRGTSKDLNCCSLKKRKYGDMEEEESTYLRNVRFNLILVRLILVLILSHMVDLYLFLFFLLCSRIMDQMMRGYELLRQQERLWLRENEAQKAISYPKE